MSSFKTDNFTFLDYTEMDDVMSRLVWECRNLPEIRKWMVNSDSISFMEHSRFIERLKLTGNSQYYCIIYNKSFIGSINIQYESQESAERGIYLHPDFFGRNLALKVCNEFYAYLRDYTTIRYITTKVLQNNFSSNRLEESLHANKIDEDGKFNYYRIDIALPKVIDSSSIANKNP